MKALDCSGLDPYGDPVHFQQRNVKKHSPFTTRAPVELVTILQQKGRERNFPLDEASSAPTNEFFVSIGFMEVQIILKGVAIWQDADEKRAIQQLRRKNGERLTAQSRTEQQKKAEKMLSVKFRTVECQDEGYVDTSAQPTPESKSRRPASAPALACGRSRSSDKDAVLRSQEEEAWNHTHRDRGRLRLKKRESSENAEPCKTLRLRTGPSSRGGKGQLQGPISPGSHPHKAKLRVKIRP